MNLRDIVDTGKLENSVELYYACLLGKYIKSKNESLSLEGIDVSSFKDTVDNSLFYRYFCYAIDNGFITDLDIELPDFDGDIDGLSSDLYMGSFVDEKPFFYETDGNVFWLNTTDSGQGFRNLSIFNESIQQSALIDLTAYFHVEGYYSGTHYQLHAKLSQVLRSSPLGVPALFYLANSDLTNSIYQFETYNSNDFNSLAYNAWYFIGLESGHITQDGSTITNKRNLLSKPYYREGSVVFLYERKSTSASSKGEKLKSSMIAIVRSVTKNSITLEKVPANETRLTRVKKHESYSRGVQELYRHDDFDLVTFRETYNLTSLGVEYLMSDDPHDYEQYFIAPILSNQTYEMWVEQDGMEMQFPLPVRDAVFWVLKDWDVNFDEQKYIENYYSEGETPLYYTDLAYGEYY